MSALIEGLGCFVAGFLFAVLLIRVAVRQRWVHTAANCPAARDIGAD